MVVVKMGEQYEVLATNTLTDQMFIATPAIAGGSLYLRSQEALYVMQLHAGYNFRPGLWLAFNGAHASGGRTSVGGMENQDVQHNSRYGATLSLPIDNGWSAKLAWSKGFATRAGGDYEILALVLQYRWFDQ